MNAFPLIAPTTASYVAMPLVKCHRSIVYYQLKFSLVILFYFKTNVSATLQ